MQQTGESPALLVASFGTTMECAREKELCATENALRAAFPALRVEACYGSGIVRCRLAARGVVVPSPAGALEQLAGQGVRRVAVLPTHLLPGIECERTAAEVNGWKSAFAQLEMGAPLLGDFAAVRQLAALLPGLWPREESEALVLMAHGTPHVANSVYPAMEALCRSAGQKQIYIGTVEGWPGADEVLKALQNDGVHRVVLAPLLLVAGDHAQNDLGGPEPESWASRFAAAGLTVRCDLRGLGQFDAIHRLYVERAARLLSHFYRKENK